MPSLVNCRCILVVGATAGIGRALTRSLYALPSKPTVIGAGRRKERLDELVDWGKKQGDTRLKALQLDISADRQALISSVDQYLEKYPDTDAVIFSSGIQHSVDFSNNEAIDLDDVAAEWTTNYTSIFTMVSKAFLPHFRKIEKQGRPSFIVPISSGLAIRPTSSVTNYCATKAALHSLCMSLQQSLRGTNIHTIEIMPPLVESELHDQQGTTERLSKFWMSLDDFTSAVMDDFGKLDGSGFIAIGSAKDAFDRFEKGKADFDSTV
ncbi:hypothetical protein OF83DRAFT_1161670 [Amylostereum chailletii]|nr:hypothetical protein OF83DRAFT_1161670 [Amylostereum chailletii]